MMSTRSCLKASSLRDDTVTFILVFHKHEVVAYKRLPHEQDVSICTGAYELKRRKTGSILLQNPSFHAQLQ